MTTNELQTGTTDGWDWTAYPTAPGQVKLIARRGAAACHIERVPTSQIGTFDIASFWRGEISSPRAKPVKSTVLDPAAM